MSEVGATLKEIFSKALDCPSPAERERYLTEACGGNAARNFRTVGCASILSRHRQKAGYFGYMLCPSFVSPNAYVLGRT